MKHQQSEQGWETVTLPEPVARQIVLVVNAIARLDESIDRLLLALGPKEGGDGQRVADA